MNEAPVKSAISPALKFENTAYIVPIEYEPVYARNDFAAHDFTALRLQDLADLDPAQKGYGFSGP